MTILDELLAATKLKLPERPTDKFWETLVRAIADESIVDEQQWDNLSDDAREWANAGTRAVTARVAKEKSAKDGRSWHGDRAALVIVPLVVVPTPGPVAAPSPAPKKDLDVAPPAKTTREKRPGGPKKTAKKVAAIAKPKTTKKAAKRSTRKQRPTAFKSGHCYEFIKHMIVEVTHIDECVPNLLNARFREAGVKLTDSSANMMMYDTICVLRVLRDLGLYVHPITEVFPEAGKENGRG